MEQKLTQEELAAMTEARRASQAMVKRMSHPGDNFIIVDDLVLDKENNERVIMTAPRSFFLTLDDHRRVKFTQGICSVPVGLSTHWYVKAHDCKTYSGNVAPKLVVAAAALGSDELPNIVRIGEDKRPIGDFILAAQTRAKMSVVDWNALSDEERHGRIVAELRAAVAEAEAVREAAALAQRNAQEKSEAEARAKVDAAAQAAADKTKSEPDKTS
jgi:hypothetical protein